MFDSGPALYHVGHELGFEEMTGALGTFFASCKGTRDAFQRTAQRLESACSVERFRSALLSQ